MNYYIYRGNISTGKINETENQSTESKRLSVDPLKL